ncbi:MAG: aspartate/glutamate racemase family protein, partial [Flavobacteriaceae bacterium]|nr:aspartate/glutamate racemase family protein [Flavobacteriaceae bacterium]
KPSKEIINLSIKNTQFLLNQNCKMIVVACNTATTNAISILRKKFSVPFIGIEPAIKPAALNTKSGIIGILATRGTLSSKLFHHTAQIYGGNIKVIEKNGDGIVKLIEEGHLESEELFELVKSYIKPMIDEGVDQLVLGCTHYSFLIPMLSEIIPGEVSIVDPGQAVARQTSNILYKYGLKNPSINGGRVELFSNSNPDLLKELSGFKDAKYLSF